jgi:hypothetical protein
MSRPDRIVLFLGAGASASFGYPVTSDIFRNVWEGINGRRPFPAIMANCKTDGSEATHDRTIIKDLVTNLDRLDLVNRSSEVHEHLVRDWEAGLKKALCELLPGLKSDRSALPSITDVLSMLDHFLSARDVPLPMFQPRFLEDLRTRLEYAVLLALGGPDDPVAFHNRRHLLIQLARWLCGTSRPTDSCVTLISTNYDILIETEIYGASGPLRPPAPIHEAIDFGFPWRDPGDGRIHHTPVNPCVCILKLHGSLNWLRCPLCGYTYIQRDGAIFQLAFDGAMTHSNTCHCGHGALRPVIIAPSSVRQIQDTNLLLVWQRALEALRDSHVWYIIGYSLPPEDLAIRSILMRAYHAHWHSDAPEVHVIQWDGLKGSDREANEGRFRLIFPDASFDYTGIEGFIQDKAAVPLAVR